MFKKGLFQTFAVFAISASSLLLAVDPVASKSSDVSSQTSHDEIAKISEAFGHFIGRNLNSPGVKFDLESVIKGMRDGASGKPAPMSDEEYEAAMTQLQEKLLNGLAEENLKAANSFLEKNALEAGVVEIEPHKLQYLILEEGRDPVITEHGTPLINYVGKFIDGSVFGSSLDVGGPISLPLDQTIQGFSKGVIGMKEGEKRRLFVHPDLGYGKTGHLPPNSLLIFDIEVVKAVAPEKDLLGENDDLDQDVDEDRFHGDDDVYDEDDNEIDPFKDPVYDGAKRK